MSAPTIPSEVAVVSFASKQLYIYQIPLSTPIQRAIVSQTWKPQRNYGVAMWKTIDDADWNHTSVLFDTALLAQAGGHIAVRPCDHCVREDRSGFLECRVNDVWPATKEGQDACCVNCTMEKRRDRCSWGGENQAESADEVMKKPSTALRKEWSNKMNAQLASYTLDFHEQKLEIVAKIVRALKTGTVRYVVDFAGLREARKEMDDICSLVDRRIQQTVTAQANIDVLCAWKNSRKLFDVLILITALLLEKPLEGLMNSFGEEERMDMDLFFAGVILGGHFSSADGVL